MFAANQNDPNQRELDPNKRFDGLGLVGWFRLLFQTRRATILQCDMTVDLLMRKLDALEGEARILRRTSALVPALYEALEKQHDFQGLYHVTSYRGSNLEDLTLNALTPLREAL